MEWKVPLTTLILGEEEVAAAARVIRSGWLAMGSEVAAFEEEFAKATGTRFAVAVANATDGLALAYDCVGLSQGDEVAMPALTFVASMNVALRRGEKPLLVDITSEDDLTMSPEDLHSKITSSTRMIVTMPYGGFPPDMDAIMKVADKKKIPVVEDACHAPLATWRGHPIGSFGQVGVYSFFSNKNMTTGEGGMLVTSDRVIAERARMMRNHGMTRSTAEHYKNAASEYDVLCAGHNFRMDEIRAAIGREQLRKLPEATRQRARVAKALREGIQARVPDIRFPFTGMPSHATSAHHLLVAILPKEVPRTSFMRSMADHGVQTSIHYKPLHRFQHVKDTWPRPPRLPILESIESRLVTLPLGPGFTEEQIQAVINAVAASMP